MNGASINVGDHLWLWGQHEVVVERLVFTSHGLPHLWCDVFYQYVDPEKHRPYMRMGAHNFRRKQKR